MTATFCALLVRDIRHHRAEEIARTTRLADDIIRSELERGTQVMASMAALLAVNQELAAEFRRRDRARATATFRAHFRATQARK
jgi:hypothetical protein